ncbi:ATG8-interacting protein 1-like [Silene latifolia]|uniref:ATG8-interacting protein 1-like n=1 Tax=Silene latifolia TaxID=37657 RepID=UPI003D76BDCE
MANNEEGEETISHETAEHEEGGEAIVRGNDWEVVSLTASAYAAAPGPRGVESIYEDSDTKVSGSDEAETSQALFMSGHFVFPPSQHENLPIVPAKTEKDVKEYDFVNEMNVMKECQSEGKLDDEWKFQGLDVNEFNEPIAQCGLKVDDKEQDLYGTAKLGSFHTATVICNPAAYDHSPIASDLVEASLDVIDPTYLISQSPRFVNEDEADNSELPCEAWWKKGMASLCAQAKQTSAFWSVFIAAAVMGLVVLGQRWQQEKWQMSLIDEKPARILPRFKDVIAGGSHRATFVTAASAASAEL